MKKKLEDKFVYLLNIYDINKLNHIKQRATDWAADKSEGQRDQRSWFRTLMFLLMKPFVCCFSPDAHRPTSTSTQTCTSCILKLTFSKNKPFILKQQMCQRRAFVSTKQKSDSNSVTIQRLKKKAPFSWANDINYTIWEELRFNLTNQTDKCFCVTNLALWFV